MNRKKGLMLAELLSILAITNIAIWWIPFNRSGAFWVGYVVLMKAIIEMAAARYFTYVGDSVKSRFLNYPLFYVMYAGGVALAILGIIFIVFNKITPKTAMLISGIVVVLNLLLLIRTDMAREEAAGVEKRVKMKSFYIGSLEQTVRGMITSGMDAPLKKELEKLADDIHYSDPMSAPALASIEREICDECEQLSEIMSDPASAMETCKKIRKLVQTRNEKCALLK